MKEKQVKIAHLNQSCCQLTCYIKLSDLVLDAVKGILRHPCQSVVAKAQ